MAKSIQLYLHVHQPWRIREYTAFDTGVDHNYFISSPHSGANNANLSADQPHLKGVIREISRVQAKYFYYWYVH